MVVSKASILALWAAVLSTACGGIDGTVIDGYAGEARAAANIRVEVRREANEVWRLCERLYALLDSAPAYAAAFDDSVRRAMTGSSVPERTIRENIAAQLYGDPYRALRRHLRAGADSIDALEVWSGQTNLQGEFATSRLSRGHYLVTAGTNSEYSEVGLRRVRLQMSYEDSRNYLFSCPGGREQLDFETMRFAEMPRLSTR